MHELDALLTPGEVAELLRVPVSTLHTWRYHGEGPAAVRVGRHVRYSRADVQRWLADRTTA